MHAAWNLLVAGASDPRAAGALALPVGVALLAPFAVVGWDVDGAAVPYVVASAALEAAYFWLLTAGYASGELSAVYPLVRGSAPVLVLFVSAAFLGAALSVAAALGVVAIAAGVVAIRGLRRGASTRATGLALRCGATVAGYTLVDNEGIRHAAAVPYLALVLAPVAAVRETSVLIAVLAAAALGRERLTPLRLAAAAAITAGTAAIALG